MKRPNDFSATTLGTLAKRVAYLCSRSTCRRTTVASHSSSEKSPLIGVAAHICAASSGPGGARYDSSMTDEERRSSDNGIWLCSNCATGNDKDEARFPVSLLRRWKEVAEKEALRLLENPNYSRLGISATSNPAASRLPTPSTGTSIHSFASLRRNISGPTTVETGSTCKAPGWRELDF